MLLEFPIPIIDKIISYLPTDDVVMLSRCNSVTNYYCNAWLYYDILITEDVLLSDRIDSFKRSTYSVLRKSKLLSFISTLTNNRLLISLIQYVTIITSSSLTNSYSTNDYESLYYILLSNYSRLKYLENLDYNNVKKCENFLQFNHNFISKKNFKKDLLYENDDLSLDETQFFTKILNLENYQIGSLNDFRLIPLESSSRLSKLSVMIEQVYNERIDIDDFQLNDTLIRKFNDLKILELNSSISTEIFLTKILNLKKNVVKFSNLETLSLTYIHSIRSHFELLLNNDNFNKIFKFSTLKNLELKLNCDDINCQICFEDFVTILIPQLTNLEKLSIIYITNENLLANSRIDFDNNTNHNMANFKSVWSKTISELDQLTNLKYLYLNLNDFTFIPFLKISNINTSNLINIFNFNISQEYLINKFQNFDTLCRLPLRCLVLPDFFYNWKLFEIQTGEIEYDLQFLSYLNKCDCDDCNESRYLFKTYSESYEFIDSNKLVSHNHKPNGEKKKFKFPIKSKHLSMGEIKNYRFFYNSFIRNLKQRLPYTDKIFKNQSGLTILDKPFNEFNLIGAINEEYYTKRGHYNKFINLIVHNLYDSLKYFILSNKNLNKLVLGGIFFEIEKLSENRYNLKGIYDEFNLNIELV